MTGNIYLYLIVAALTLYAVRALPMTLIRKDIKSPFIRSFLYYVPYVVLAAMTFPAVFSSTGTTASSAAGCIAAVILAFCKRGLLTVAVGASAAAYIVLMLGL